MDLWSYNFSRLLIVGRQNGGISYRAALVLARRSSFPCPAPWPEMMRVLNSIYHRRASYQDLNRLYDDPLFVLLEQRTPDDPPGPFAMPSGWSSADDDDRDGDASNHGFVSGFLCPRDGLLHNQWQRRLLTGSGGGGASGRPLCVPDALANDPTALRNLAEGIKLLDREEDIRVREGDMKKKLLLMWRSGHHHRR